MKRYVVVVESLTEDNERGVDDVYAGPEGQGFPHWEAVVAQAAVADMLKASGEYDDKGARAVVVQLAPVPSTARDRMNRAVKEAEAAQRAKLGQARLAVVEDVDPPVTELWDAQRKEAQS